MQQETNETTLERNHRFPSPVVLIPCASRAAPRRSQSSPSSPSEFAARVHPLAATSLTDVGSTKFAGRPRRRRALPSGPAGVLFSARPCGSRTRCCRAAVAAPAFAAAARARTTPIHSTARCPATLRRLRACKPSKSGRDVFYHESFI